MQTKTSAHAAFDKACAYFEVEPRRVDVKDDWRADVEAMRSRVDRNTVLVVASAPQYPQGVVDDVTGIAALALDADCNCHVDACMGLKQRCFRRARVWPKCMAGRHHTLIALI